MNKARAVYEFVPIYDRGVFYTNDQDAALKLIKHRFKGVNIDTSLVEGNKLCHGFVAPILCKDDDEKVHGYVMFIKDSSDLGVIAHEAVHLVNFIFDYIGQELDLLNDEAQAYLTGYFVKRFMETVREAPIKKRKKKGV